MSKIKSLARRIYRLPASAAIKVLDVYVRTDQERFFDSILRDGFRTWEKGSDYFLSYQLRPKESSKIVSMEEESHPISDTAIVIQGPIVTEEDFTMNTIELYRKIFPGVRVIVSCWEDDDTSTIEPLVRGGVICIKNKKPEEPGFCNLNLQISSTMAGLRMAEGLGMKYVLKSRSDMRLYKVGSLDFMRNIIENHPICDEGLKLKKRIVTADFRCLGTQYWPFFIGDQWSFGLTEDMLRYWDMTPCGEGGYDAYILQRKDKDGRRLFSRKERTSKRLLAEGNIVLDFISRQTEKKPDITVEEYWEFVRKYVTVIDRRLVDFYWFKYDCRFEENLHNGSYSRADSDKSYYTYSWDFLSWCNLYYGSKKYRADFEKLSETNDY